MRRRSLLKGLPAALAGARLGAGGIGTGKASAADDGRTDLSALTVRTPCSLVGPDGGPAPDAAVVVRTEPTARSMDADGNGDARPVGADRIPLAAVEGPVLGVGGPLVTDDHDVAAGNEEFLLNVWDDLLGGGTVVWEEAHDPEYNLEEDYDLFRHYAIENGYGIEASEEFEAAVQAADGLVVPAPQDPYSDAELDRLREFVDAGGALFLFDRSDAENDDGTGPLNAVCERLGAGFRFNDDRVVDPENNDGDRTNPRTTQFAGGVPYFEDRQGLDDFELRREESYLADVIDVADGDTVDVRFDSGTTEAIRVLGIDTPETAPNDRFERPEEWEGLAYDYERSRLERLRFADACSLRAAGGGPLTGEGRVAVTAEPTATVEDNDGEGPTGDYGDDPVPLVAVDGRVVGVGAIMVGAEADFEADNEEFLVNVLNHFLGSGTVLWDESHDGFYTLSEVEPFPEYAADNNYSVVATDALADDLGTADAVVVTSPSRAFTDAELDALRSFRDDGGVVLLHSQADFRNFDETDNVNEVAAALDAAFRFNDDQVVDPEENDGEPFQPVTTAFSPAYPSFFYDRAGADGGAIDRTTPHLTGFAERGKEVARDRLSGGRVRVEFDPNEPVRDQFDRVLAYLYYDPDGDGERDRLYNRELVADGLARIYGSGNDRHREFWLAEAEARSAGRGVWSESDVAGAPTYRNRPVESVFVPSPASVRTVDGPLPDRRAPVRTASTASQAGGAAVAYEGEAPLVGVDPEARTAVVGGPILEESFEQFEGYPVDTSVHENYVLLANLVAGLADRDAGPVLIDGGHGQFGADHAASSEDAAYFQRFLEGQGFTLEQRNELTPETLDEAAGRALVVTSPAAAFSEAELSAVTGFRDAGGGVVLVGSGEASTEDRGHLNALAEALGTDLRINADELTDPENPLDDDPRVFVTRTFADGYGGLFGPYDGSVTFPDRARRQDAPGGDSTATTTGAADRPTTGGSGRDGGNGGGGGDGLLLPGIAGGVVAGGLGVLGLRRLLADDEGDDDDG